MKRKAGRAQNGPARKFLSKDSAFLAAQWLMKVYPGQEASASRRRKGRGEKGGN